MRQELWEREQAAFRASGYTGAWISDRDLTELQRKADAYPKLVKALKKYVSNGFLDGEKLLKSLGELT
jgi:hypothetical protein